MMPSTLMTKVISGQNSSWREGGAGRAEVVPQRGPLVEDHIREVEGSDDIRDRPPDRTDVGLEDQQALGVLGILRIRLWLHFPPPVTLLEKSYQLVRDPARAETRALEEARRPFLLEIRDKRITPADERKILAQAVAQTLWRGVQNITVGGQPLVFRVAEAAQMLAQPAWLNLLEFIIRTATDRAALLADEETRAAGN